MLPKLGSPFAFPLWVAARLLLIYDSTAEKLSPQIQLLINALQEMGRYWPVAQQYAAILQPVLGEDRDSEFAADARRQRSNISSVNSLGDLRRSTHSLDFLISSQPKHFHTLPLMPSITPATTLASDKLEYLECFDFFNVVDCPRH
jgi:hypothetical protein